MECDLQFLRVFHSFASQHKYGFSVLIHGRYYIDHLQRCPATVCATLVSLIWETHCIRGCLVTIFQMSSPQYKLSYGLLPQPQASRYGPFVNFEFSSLRRTLRTAFSSKLA